MTDKKKLLGQYGTPTNVADLILGFCVRSPADHLLDPSCGDGAFLVRASRFLEWLNPKSRASNRLWGVELDPLLAAQAQLASPQSHIICRDFFDMDPLEDSSFDAVIGNPPYTRSEWIDQVSDVRREAQQLHFFLSDNQVDSPPERTRSGLEHQIRRDKELAVLGRRAGLHAFFFIHGLEFLREGGRFGFVVPNSWLDVAYGERLKRFLLEHYKILAVIESNIERWFKRARINTCLVILEKCADFESRMTSPVHLVRIKKPLGELIPFGNDDLSRFNQVKDITGKLLAPDDFDDPNFSVRIHTQQDLAPSEKWGIYLRSPAAYQRRLSSTALQPLSAWASVKRGFTTGANAFFYLDKSVLDEWPIEPEYYRPLLKSLRHVDQRSLSDSSSSHKVLIIDPQEDLSGKVVEQYITWGETQGWHSRRTCASRPRWYSLPHQEGSPLLLPKGIWGRHFAVLAEDEIFVDQQIYLVSLTGDVPVLVAAALFNSAWFALQLELHGRVNFGEGVLWMALYELEELLLPDPRYWADASLARLEKIMKELALQPVEPITGSSSQESWNELNGVIFDLMGFTPPDRDVVINSLKDRVSARQTKAHSS